MLRSALHTPTVVAYPLPSGATAATFRASTHVVDVMLLLALVRTAIVACPGHCGKGTPLVIATTAQQAMQAVGPTDRSCWCRHVT